jgi:hypothetical protein
MHDYRDEKFYIVFLLYYLVSNLQKNSKKRNILTKTKLMNIYHLVNNPILLKKAFKHFALGDLKSYQPDLYERSLLPSDFQENEKITKSFIYLCHIKRIKINDDGTIETVDTESDSFSEISTDFLNDNLVNLKKMATKSESQLTKLVMD